MLVRYLRNKITEYQINSRYSFDYHKRIENLQMTQFQLSEYLSVQLIYISLLCNNENGINEYPTIITNVSMSIDNHSNRTSIYTYNNDHVRDDR